jgi:hypothetical protein
MKPDYRQWTHPIVIGSGQRLVREGSGTTDPWLLDRQAFHRDVIIVTYQRLDDDDRTSPLFDGWKPTATGSITELAMAMLGVSPVRKPDQDR